MKNASSALRGAPMPGGRSFTQFRTARIRRVAFQTLGKERIEDEGSSGLALPASEPAKVGR